MVPGWKSFSEKAERWHGSIFIKKKKKKVGKVQ